MMRLGASIALAMITTRCLSAQAPPPTPCELTEDRVQAAVAAGHPEALRELRGCPERGTRLLNGLWSRGAASPELLPHLREATETFRTSAIFHIVESSANNSSYSDPLRLTALQVLLKYVDPELELPDEKLATVTPRGEALWPCIGCGTMAWDSSYTPPLRSRALAVFERLARDGTPELRRVATAVLDALDPNMVGQTPISWRTLTGVLDCDRRQLTITNASPVDWPVSISQEGVADPIRTRVAGTWGGDNGVTRWTLTDRTPVTLTFGARRLFRLECGAAPEGPARERTLPTVERPLSPRPALHRSEGPPP